MKRKGRRSKTSLNISNGVDQIQNESVDEQSKENDDNPKEKSAKRRSASKKPVDLARNNDQQENDEESVENINQNGQSIENTDDGQPEIKKRRSNKRKSSTKPLEEPVEEENEDSAQYEVEGVLDEKMIKGVRHYLIRWKGYEPESDSWEPEKTLDCPELIAEFKVKQKKKGNKKSKSKTGIKQKEITWDENDKFEVDRILEVYFKKNGAREFLVSWKGYPLSESTWEPEENMDCPELIQRFMEKVEEAKKADRRELRVSRPHTDRFTLAMATSGRRLSKRNEGKQRVHYHDAE